MLRPQSIVVIGVSAKRVTEGNNVLGNLQTWGFDGSLHVVHPTADVLQGVKATRQVSDLPIGIDCAYVSLPAAQVIDVLTQLVAVGCRSAVVPSLGVADTEQAAFRSLAREMVIHGPNCTGFINYSDRVCLWSAGDVRSQTAPGSIALIAQSGAATWYIPRTCETANFSKVISTGNEWAVSTADYLAWLSTDDHTRAAAVVIESIRDVDDFRHAVGLMRAAGKPVVALRVGRSLVGSRMATAHTGALVGNDQAYRAFFDELDVPLVADYDEMASVVDCYAKPSVPTAGGVRLGVLTISGGQAALAADLAERNGVAIAEISEATTTKLSEIIDGLPGQNPLDIAVDPKAQDYWGQCIDAMAADPSVDTVVAIFDAQISAEGGELFWAEQAAVDIAERAGSAGGKPLITASSSAVSTKSEVRGWFADTPLLRGLPNAFVVARALAMNQAPVRQLADVERVSVPADLDAIRAEIQTLHGPLPADIASRLLAAYGIPTARSGRATTADEAVVVADSLGYPVVVKVSSRDIPHRADVGGVVTAIGDPDGVRQAIADIQESIRRKAPTATIDGFEVQEHLGNALEASVGFVSDPIFGPTVAMGSGGALVELLADVEVGLAPLSQVEAERILRRTRLAKVANGYRNLIPTTSLGELSGVVAALSALAADCAPLLVEGDLNPVLVEAGTGRARIVDALLVAGGA